MFCERIGWVTKKMPEILEDAETACRMSRELFSRLLTHFRELDRQVKELEGQSRPGTVTTPRVCVYRGFRHWTDHGERLVASIGDASAFKSGRQLAAWLAWCRGKVPPEAKYSCSH